MICADRCSIDCAKRIGKREVEGDSQVMPGLSVGWQAEIQTSSFRGPLTNGLPFS